MIQTEMDKAIGELQEIKKELQEIKEAIKKGIMIRK